MIRNKRDSSFHAIRCLCVVYSVETFMASLGCLYTLPISREPSSSSNVTDARATSLNRGVPESPNQPTRSSTRSTGDTEGRQEAENAKDIVCLAFRNGHAPVSAEANLLALSQVQQVSEEPQELKEERQPQTIQAEAVSAANFTEPNSKLAEGSLPVRSSEEPQEPGTIIDNASCEKQVFKPEAKQESKTSKSKTKDPSAQKQTPWKAPISGGIDVASTTENTPTSTSASTAEEQVTHRPATPGPSTIELKTLTAPGSTSTPEGDGCSICRIPYSLRSTLQPCGHEFDFKCIMT